MFSDVQETKFVYILFKNRVLSEGLPNPVQKTENRSKLKELSFQVKLPGTVLFNMVATSHLWHLNLKSTSLVTLATFSVLKSHICLVSKCIGYTDTGHSNQCRNSTGQHWLEANLHITA